MNKEIPLTLIGFSFLGFYNVGGLYAVVPGLISFAVAFWYNIKKNEENKSIVNN